MEEIISKLNELQKSIEVLLTNQVSEIMNFEQCLQLTGFSKGLLYRMTSNREIPHYKKGRILFFKRSEVEAWLVEDRVGTQEELEQEAEIFLRRIKQRT